MMELRFTDGDGDAWTLPIQKIEAMNVQAGDIIIFTIPRNTPSEVRDATMKGMRSAFGPDRKLVLQTDDTRIQVVRGAD